jgi:hypothetical protein
MVQDAVIRNFEIIGAAVKRLSITWSSRHSLRKLGDTAHVSVLLRKACELSGCSEKGVGEWLLQRTNVALESEGLYLTHLFREVDVILQPD